MRPLVTVPPLLILTACRACEAPVPTPTTILPGTYGHETMTLAIASHGDHLVAAYAALFDGDRQECACLLDMQRQGPGRWEAAHAGQRVVLATEGEALTLTPAGGDPIDLACCGTGWPGDRAALNSRTPLGSCTTVSPTADVFLPVPYVEEPEAS